MGLLSLLFHVHRFRTRGPAGGRCDCGLWVPPTHDPAVMAARNRWERRRAGRLRRRRGGRS